MGTLLWLNISLMVLFFACWAGIPLRLVLTRWHAEVSAKHAEIAAKASRAAGFVPPVPAAADETAGPAYAGAPE
jgi:hypothetical protein